MASNTAAEDLLKLGLQDNSQLVSSNSCRPVYTIRCGPEGASLQTSRGKTYINGVLNPLNDDEMLFFMDVEPGWKERAQIRKASHMDGVDYCEIRSNAEKNFYDVWEYEEGDILFLAA
jgi:hypothetical protein